MENLDLSPPTVCSVIKICYLVAMLMQIFHAILMVENRGNSLSRGSSLCFSERSVCVWNMLPVSEGLGVFSKLFWSQESIVHV